MTKWLPQNDAEARPHPDSADGAGVDFSLCEIPTPSEPLPSPQFPSQTTQPLLLLPALSKDESSLVPSTFMHIFL